MPYPHAYITLTPEEKESIKQELQRLTYARQWRKRKPLQALWLSNEKKTFRNISGYLEVDYSTVRNWVYRYRKEGLEGLISWMNRSGFGKGRSV